MHYLIYIPGETRQTREILAEVGFEGLLQPGEPDPLYFPVEAAGPDGGNGLLVLPYQNPVEDHNPQPAHLADRQDWKQIPGSDCWIGWQTDNRPTPLDLLRGVAPVYPGPAITLGDGQQWCVPACFDQKHVMVPNGAGGWGEDTSPRWPDLYAKAAPLFAELEAGLRRDATEDDYTFQLDNAAASTFLCDLLALNFRVTPGIVGALGLIDRDNIPLLVAVATDHDRLIRLTKELDSKNQPAPNS